ncbi:hypothetical protein D9M73_227970 [compost metagenome]
MKIGRKNEKYMYLLVSAGFSLWVTKRNSTKAGSTIIKKFGFEIPQKNKDRASAMPLGKSLFDVLLADLRA